MSASRSSPPRVPEEDDERHQRRPRAPGSPKETSPSARRGRGASSPPSTSKSGYGSWATTTQAQEQAPPLKPRTRPPRSRGATTGTTTATTVTEASTESSDEESDELDEDEDRQERALSTTSDQIPSDQQLSPNQLVYELIVVQQPQRARACGFGDKDRRPLSPPPIIQLRIFDKLGNAIKPHAMDVHRFILMVDLWNGDQTQQRSIVMHPGARPDQYALFTHTAASRTPSAHRFDLPHSTFSRMPPHRSSTGPNPGPYNWQGPDWPQHYGRPSPSPAPPYPPLPSASPYAGAPGSGPAPAWRSPGYPEASPIPSASPAWTSNYTLPPEEYDYHRSPPHSRGPIPGEMGPPLPMRDPHGRPLESVTMSEYGSERRGSSWSSYRQPSGSTESGWAMDPYREQRPHTSSLGEFDRMNVHHLPGRPWSSTASDPQSQSRSWSSHGPLYTHHPSPIAQSSLPLTASPTPTNAALYPDPAYPERMSTTSHYSRVLVGSMGAVCQRLKDLDGEPGLFFFAHDLGIRTEGTFSLRFTLVDISALTGPEVRKDDATNILARVFSDAFTVYSAKRFPGVLPTTDLTQCFADQSVRLPTRQKRANASGSSDTKRKK